MTELADRVRRRLVADAAEPTAENVAAALRLECGLVDGALVLEVIDQLIAAGTPVDAVDQAFGGHPLREAAVQGRLGSVERLLAHGADPNLEDGERRKPLDYVRRGRAGYEETERFDQVEALLAPLTRTD